MSIIDRNILRLSVYEMVFLSDIPVPVTINEAIEVAKEFGSETSAAFVNGILDKLGKGMEKGEFGDEKCGEFGAGGRRRSFGKRGNCGF